MLCCSLAASQSELLVCGTALARGSCMAASKSPMPASKGWCPWSGALPSSAAAVLHCPMRCMVEVKFEVEWLASSGNDGRCNQRDGKLLARPPLFVERRAPSAK